MRTQNSLGLLGAIAAVGLTALVASPAWSQTAPKAGGKSGKGGFVTPWGEPDLQGIWSNATTTPLERPNGLGKDVLTDEETAAADEQTAENRNTDRRDGKGTDVDVERAYNEFWWERGKSMGRTSMITDPADGRIPALTPEGQKQAEAIAARREALGKFDSWESRNLHERCIVYHSVPPLPTGYNNNYQIVQSPGYVSIFSEMIHEVRIISLDGRPHTSGAVRQQFGDSRGHWEGDTLVVDTVNFTPLNDLNERIRRGTGDTLHVIERFRRVAADAIDYQFTVDDPKTFTKQWTAMLPMKKIPGPLFEYACHEGNYGMFGILSGGRAQDRKAAEQKKGSN